MRRGRIKNTIRNDHPEAILFELREILWPHGEYEDHQWTASEIEYLAETLIENGYGPIVLEDSEGELRYSNT